MKDQVAALRWVKRNIAHFGGNPDDVTIFGQSAGGISVESHLLSSMTEGLFHRAISESGSALNINFDKNYTLATFSLGEILGYNGTDADQLVKFLRSMPSEDIGLYGMSLGFTIGLDAQVQEGQEIFLAELPENLLRAGKSHQVPYIIGVNSKEQKYLFANVTQDEQDSLYQNLEQYIPVYLNLKSGSAESFELVAKLKKFYFGNKTISFDTLPELVDLASDTMIYPVYRSAMIHVNNGSSPLYTYMFTYNSRMHILPESNTTNVIKGPAHTDELPYLFYLNYLDMPYNPNSEEMTLIKHFTGMWVDFAQSGDPSLHESVNWSAGTRTNHTYLQIDVQLSVHQDMLRERMAFWDEVYATYKK